MLTELGAGNLVDPAGMALAGQRLDRARRRNPAWRRTAPCPSPLAERICPRADRPRQDLEQGCASA